MEQTYTDIDAPKDSFVVNPLQIKRFAQTKLKRTKTDKVDAALIAEYGERMQPKL